MAEPDTTKHPVFAPEPVEPASAEKASRSAALMQETRFHFDRSDYEKALALSRQAADAAHAAGNRDLEAEALCLVSSTQTGMGFANEGMIFALRARDLAQAIGNKMLEARALICMFQVAYDKGDLPRCHDLLDQALVLAEEAGSAEDCFWALNNLCHLHWIEAVSLEQEQGPDAPGLRASAERQLRLIDAALCFAHQTIDRHHQAYALGSKANALILLGRLDDARALIESCAQIGRETNTPRIIAYAELDQCRILQREGRAPEAIARLTTQTHGKAIAPDEDLQVATLELLVDLYKATGQTDLALRNLEGLRSLERQIAIRRGDREISLIMARIEVDQARETANRLRAEAVAMEQANRELQNGFDLLNRAVMLDALTGAGNRRAAELAIADRVSRAASGPAPFVLAFADVDKFKGINDRFGHSTGDAVLQIVATILRNGLRKGDEVFRFGGDEFVLLIGEDISLRGFEVCERLRRRVLRHDWAALDPDLRITISFGQCAWHQGEDAAALVARADAAMYQAKRDGRNRVAEG